MNASATEIGLEDPRLSFAFLREEGYLDALQWQLFQDFLEMGKLKEGAFWAVSMILASSNGNLCVPTDNPSRLREILSTSLTLPALDRLLTLHQSFRLDQLGDLVGLYQPGASPADGAAKADKPGKSHDGSVLTAESSPSSEHSIPFRPFIFMEGYLFLHAHFYYRQRFIDSIVRRTGRTEALISSDILQAELTHLLKAPQPLTAEQAQAVLLSGMLPLVLITGGPGSGKTSTIYAILKVALKAGLSPEDIRIAAPTGRAASRVLESLQSRAESDPDLGEVMNRLESSTLHRMLGATREGFYHDARLPVPARLVIVDELSMVDVTLMGRLLDAVDPAGTTLVLIGDPNQLPSVEAGAVLQDFLRIREAGSGQEEVKSVYESLQESFPSMPALQNSPEFAVFLKGSHRFGGELMEFSELLRSGSVEESTLSRYYASIDSGNPFEGQGLTFLSSEDIDPVELLLLWMDSDLSQLYGPGMDLERSFEMLNSRRILSPVRKGALGVEAVNRACSQIIQEKVGIPPSDWFAGMPLLLHRNDNVRRLYNGDTGIVAPGPGGELQAHFLSSHGAETREGRAEQSSFSAFRSFQRDSLPEHEPAFCHTIHKSQGSEYDTVLILLEKNEEHRLPLSRELIYTAITRARKKCILYGDRSFIAEACNRRMVRETGPGI